MRCLRRQATSGSSLGRARRNHGMPASKQPARRGGERCEQPGPSRPPNRRRSHRRLWSNRSRRPFPRSRCHGWGRPPCGHVGASHGQPARRLSVARRAVAGVCARRRDEGAGDAWRDAAQGNVSRRAAARGRACPGAVFPRSWCSGRGRFGRVGARHVQPAGRPRVARISRSVAAISASRRNQRSGHARPGRAELAQ